MPEFDNEKALCVQKGKSPYELARGTAGTTSDVYGIPATGEFPGAINMTTLSHQVDRHRASQRQRVAVSQLPSPEARATFRTYVKSAKDAAGEMLAAASAQDPMALTIATDNLDITLAKLWDLRDLRDFNWQGILNHAQGMLKQLFAEKRVEQLTPDQCRSINDLIENFLGPSTKTTADLNEAIRTIKDAGCDPYWAISGNPAEDEHGSTHP